MSLFDVLKYPISDEPTKEELSSLPNILLIKWALAVKWITRPYERIHNFEFMNIVDFYKDRSGIHPDITELRKMIKEYDEPL